VKTFLKNLTTDLEDLSYKSFNKNSISEISQELAYTQTVINKIKKELY